jgi:hypothetical protein
MEFLVHRPRTLTNPPATFPAVLQSKTKNQQSRFDRGSWIVDRGSWIASRVSRLASPCSFSASSHCSLPTDHFKLQSPSSHSKFKIQHSKFLHPPNISLSIRR